MDVSKAGGGAAAAAGARPAGGGAAADFLQQSGAPRPGVLPATAAPGAVGAAAGVGAGERRANAAANSADRRTAASENRAGRVENREQLHENRQELADEIRKECNDTPVRDFWGDHPAWGAWAITRPFRWASWGAVDSWTGYGAEQTGYSYGENVYYEDGAVYSDGQQIATEEEYAQQAEALAASAPDSAENQEWMSLGVFAVTQDGQKTGAPPTLFMQLVLSKQGVLGGTLENKTSGETQPLEGMVDKTSQRAAWGIAGKQRPIIETGISNLTKETTPTLVHFADGTTQQWLLVRLDEPMK